MHPASGVTTTDRIITDSKLRLIFSIHVFIDSFPFLWVVVVLISQHPVPRNAYFPFELTLEVLITHPKPEKYIRKLPFHFGAIHRRRDFCLFGGILALVAPRLAT
jgi:hypothetical protein